MTHTTAIKTLREEHIDILARRNAFVLELKAKYHIPTEEISRYFDLDNERITKQERYMEALTTPWWKLVWYKLTTRKK